MRQILSHIHLQVDDAHSIGLFSFYNSDFRVLLLQIKSLGLSSHTNTGHFLLSFLPAHFPAAVIFPSLSSSVPPLILGIPIAHSNVTSASIDTITGCNTCTPALWAMAPTPKGKTAAPPPPNAAAKPMAGTCICFGRSLVTATTAAGNNGPRKKPTNATAIDPPTNEGTSQKSS